MTISDASFSSTYQKVSSYEARPGEFDRCLLLYSGGLDTSVMLKWIQDQYKSKVVALCIDIGQVSDDLEEIRKKAISLGAEECIIYDAKQEFADTLLSMATKANADYQGGYALGCPLGRVMISQIAVKVAQKYKCTVVGHGCTGKGNDQVRFEGYIMTLDPKMKLLAPVREWGMGREEELAYAKKHGIPVKQTAAKPYSYDENMFASTAEGGEIENPILIPKLEEILQWCKTPQQAPDAMEQLTVEYEKGVPIKLNGQSMSLCDIVAQANKLGGKHACGVFPLIEDRIIGLKVRGIYENPGASILIAGHKKLEMLVSTREENELKSFIDQKWAYLTYGAKWFEPTMNHLHAYINDQNTKVTGKVTIQLYKGNISVVAVESPNSLFDHNLATFNKSAAFNQNASPGFIELYTLPMKSAYNVTHSK